MPNIVLRDIQARRGVLCLVDETFHKVLLVLPVVGYHVIKINLVKQLDRCIVAFLCNKIKRLELTWTLL